MPLLSNMLQYKYTENGTFFTAEAFFGRAPVEKSKAVVRSTQFPASDNEDEDSEENAVALHPDGLPVNARAPCDSSIESQLEHFNR